MLRGQFRGFSERRLIDCLTSLGRDVQIVIKEAPKRRATGKITVVVAYQSGLASFFPTTAISRTNRDVRLIETLH